METVLILRTVRPDRRSYGGFEWPESGPVECPDWNPQPVCGGGLHGLLWGEGDAGLLHDPHASDTLWQIVEVAAADVIRIDNSKVKFPRGNVLLTGTREDASRLLYSRLPAGIAPHFLLLTGGDRSRLTGGNDSRITGGYGSTLTGGDYSQLTGGNRSRLTGGDYSRLTGGDYSRLTGGDYSRLTGGDYSRLTGGDYSQLTGGNGSTLTGGNRSRLTGGDRSQLTGGNRSQLTGGYYSQLTGGYGSILTWQYFQGDPHVHSLVTGRNAEPWAVYASRDGKPPVRDEVATRRNWGIIEICLRVFN